MFEIFRYRITVRNKVGLKLESTRNAVQCPIVAVVGAFLNRCGAILLLISAAFNRPTNYVTRCGKVRISVCCFHCLNVGSPVRILVYAPHLPDQVPDSRNGHWAMCGVRQAVAIPRSRVARLRSSLWSIESRYCTACVLF